MRMTTAGMIVLVTLPVACEEDSTPAAGSDPAGDSRGQLPERQATSSTAAIGSAGGTVRIDGGAMLTIPAEALPGDTEVSLAYRNFIEDDEATGGYGGAVLGIYEIGPHGTALAEEVTLTLPVPDLPDGYDPEFVRVMYFDGRGWIPQRIVDRGAGSISASFKHFSKIKVDYDFWSWSGRGLRIDDMRVGICGDKLKLDFKTPGATLLFAGNLIREMFGQNGHYSVGYRIALVEDGIFGDVMRTVHVYSIAVNAIFPYTISFDIPEEAGEVHAGDRIYNVRETSLRQEGDLLDWYLHQHVVVFDADGVVVSETTVPGVKIEPTDNESASTDFLLHPTRADVARSAFPVALLSEEEDYYFQIEAKTIHDGAIGSSTGDFHTDEFSVSDRPSLRCDLDEPAGSRPSPATLSISSPRAGSFHGFGTRVPFEASATDGDGRNLPDGAVRWRSDRQGLIGTGRRFNRDDLSPGIHTITVEAGARGEPTSTKQIRIHIHQPRNTPPDFVTEAPWGTPPAGREWTHDFYARDGDGDEVRYRLKRHPRGMVIDEVTGRATWTPARDDLDFHHVVVEADDQHGGTDELTFGLRAVATPNHPPRVVITDRTDTATVDGDAAEFACAYRDRDGDAVVIEWTATCGEVNEASGEPCRMRLQSDQASVCRVAVTASDGKGESRASTIVRFEAAAGRGCVPEIEVCDGEDNNCEGRVDEGGVCERPGDGEGPAGGDRRCGDGCTGQSTCGDYYEGDEHGLCGPGEICRGAGLCVHCGELGEPCCGRDAPCSGGLSCNSANPVEGSCEEPGEGEIENPVPIDCGDDCSTEMVRIAAGEFMMGSPPGEPDRDRDETLHRVEITQPFLVRATEVTQAEWEAVMGENPSQFSDCGGDCPVENVSWFDAVDFCNALSRSEGLEECYVIDGRNVTWPRGLACGGYRLPTEAEWEYAARAGTQSAYHSGDGEEALDRAGWYSENAGRTTHPVAQKERNAWGLYDVHGNVWEWAWDWYASDFYDDDAASTDPIGPPAGDSRVERGGSWGSLARNCRAAFRGRFGPGFRNNYLGFRPARSVNP